jgi:hypothetical protein
MATQPASFGDFKFFDVSTLPETPFTQFLSTDLVKVPYILVKGVIADATTLEDLNGKLPGEIFGMNWVAVIKLLELARSQQSTIDKLPKVKNLLYMICIFEPNSNLEVNAQRQNALIAMIHSIYGAAALFGNENIGKLKLDALPSMNSPLTTRYRWSVKFLETIQKSTVQSVPSLKAALDNMISDVQGSGYLNTPNDRRYDSKNLLEKVLKTPANIFKADGYLSTPAATPSSPSGSIAQTGSTATPRSPIESLFSVGSRSIKEVFSFLGL